MSRVAKAVIQIPDKVEVERNKDHVIVKGPKGTVTRHCSPLVEVIIEENKLIKFQPASNDPTGWAQSGTARANVNNMILGVTKGFETTLELVGVGYRVQTQGHQVVLSVGYSHNKEYKLPTGITAETPNNTTLVLRGIDNQLLNQTAANIRSFREPEPYKGKGIKYAGEVIVRKETKKK